MATWLRFTSEAPEFAAAVGARFAAHRHHVLATLRADGAPRLSGTEVDFWRDDALIGSMLDAVKARDLRRDARFALHSNPGDGSMDGGDAKLAGRAVEVTDPDVLRAFGADRSPPEPFHLFLLDLHEVVLSWLNAARDGMVIAAWRPGAPLGGHLRPGTGPARRLAPGDPELALPPPA